MTSKIIKHKNTTLRPSKPLHRHRLGLKKANPLLGRKKKPLPSPEIDTISYIINSNFIKGLPMFIAGGIITGLLIFLIKPTLDSPITKAENELIEQTTTDIMNITHEDTQHLEDEFDRVNINTLQANKSSEIIKDEEELNKYFNDLLEEFHGITEESKTPPYGQHILKKTNSKYLADL